MAKRRGNSEGSIYKMQDGRWRAAVMVGWKISPDGKRTPDRKIFSAATRREVANDLSAALRDRDRGINIKPGKQTVGDFLAAWLEHTVKPSVRPKTYRSYEQMVRNHLSKTVPVNEWKDRELDAIPGMKDVPLSKLTLQRVQQFFNEKLTAGNSSALVRYLRVVLRVALNEALKGDLIVRNVAQLATPPKVEKRELSPFTPEQAARFLKAAMGHRLEALFTVGLAVGLRSGECSGLLWSDVDLDTGRITVRHTLQRVKHPGEKHGRLTLLPPKSEKSKRLIELPAKCVTSLKAHRERQKQECAFAGSRWVETGHVFTSTIGTPIDDRKILKDFNALVEAAKLPKQRFHDLRHACISLLGAQGVPLKVIAEIVGHSDIRLTQNVYQHVYSEAKRAAADTMDTLLTRMENGPEKPVATTVATNAASRSLQ
ncbi:MAG: site-specific integrase [Terriglobia bacterium]|nr:MAG: site-specific integrase [Terriglobia bacterium]